MAKERISTSNSSFFGNYKSKVNQGKVFTGRVIDVILDKNNQYVEIFDFSENVKEDTSLIGYAVIRTIDDSVGSTSTLRPYPPLNPDETIPLRGETVELIPLGGRFHYKRISNYNLSTGNAKPDAEKTLFPEKQKPLNSAEKYNETSFTGITEPDRTQTEDSTIGDVFTEQKIHPLKLYEGDKLIQSRFGQSIRFSGYNNIGNDFSPTIIIRNRQNEKITNELLPFDVTEEDINRDGTTIAITSNTKELNFIAGKLDKNGQTNFETKPSKFKNYPKSLKDTDQVLINSGRIILSSKDSEMIFYSKGNYGFISDGHFSINNGNFGADLDFNGDVNLSTNDFDFYVDTGAGNILLNTTDTNEPLVRGETLVGLLEELIDAINQQVYNTPAGPTAPGPNNRGTFTNIKGRLTEMLSTLNYTE